MFGFDKNNENICPLLKGPCVRNRCVWWTHVVGRNPQTGIEMDQENCAMSWIPILLVENAGRTNQVGAALESTRNEMVKATGDIARAALAQAAVGILKNNLLQENNAKNIGNG